MTFLEAVQQMKQGKKAFRPEWGSQVQYAFAFWDNEKTNYGWLMVHCDFTGSPLAVEGDEIFDNELNPTFRDIEATDWEIVE